GSYIIGKLIEIKKDAGIFLIAIAMIIGFLVLYAIGVLHLSVVGKLSFAKAVSVGMIPFLIGDAVKIVVATFVTLKLRNRIFPKK
ncbi:MAG: biotin transporter BioY, partial [Bacteroidales bacterium]|nr:biotin transporter BioY [Bacteroidales bacterium]